MAAWWTRGSEDSSSHMSRTVSPAKRAVQSGAFTRIFFFTATCVIDRGRCVRNDACREEDVSCRTTPRCTSGGTGELAVPSPASDFCISQERAAVQTCLFMSWKSTPRCRATKANGDTLSVPVNKIAARTNRRHYCADPLCTARALTFGCLELALQWELSLFMLPGVKAVQRDACRRRPFRTDPRRFASVIVVVERLARLGSAIGRG